MTSTKSWILLSQRYSQYPDIDEADILDALPDDVLRSARQPVRIENRDSTRDPLQMDWDGLQREQAAQVESFKLLALRDQGHGIIYFGRTLLPLAMDLGYRVEKWAQSRLMQYHELGQSWRWPGRPPGENVPPVLLEHNLPARASAASGDVIVRVSVTTRIAEADARAAVPGALDDIEIHLGEHCGRDALRTLDELERVARRFEEALGLIHERYPQAGMIHVFLAGPVGLAFRMGCVVNHTVHPSIQTYQFVQSAAPHKYQKALVLGRQAHAPVQLGILFLAADPAQLAVDLRKGEPQRLGSDVELREIRDRLRKGDHRDKFSEHIEVHTAVRKTDIQTYVRRSRAQILHFSGHAKSGGHLILENEAGKPEEVHRDSMRLMLELWNADKHIRCAVFNACQTIALAEVLTTAPAVVPCAVGTLAKVDDKAAVEFAVGFYEALADGLSLEQALKAGRAQADIKLRGQGELFDLRVEDPALRDQPIFAHYDRKS
jgi:SMODS-associated and fused to various effectors sensor domain/CHAT domain